MIEVKVDLAKLRAARAYKGFTIQQMSKLLGYKANGYTYLESGKVPFTLPRLNQVCKVLQIDPRQLLVFEEVVDTFKQW